MYQLYQLHASLQPAYIRKLVDFCLNWYHYTLFQYMN